MTGSRTFVCRKESSSIRDSRKHWREVDFRFCTGLQQMVKQDGLSNKKSPCIQCSIDIVQHTGAGKQKAIPCKPLFLTIIAKEPNRSICCKPTGQRRDCNRKLVAPYPRDKVCGRSAPVFLEYAIDDAGMQLPVAWARLIETKRQWSI